LGFKPLLQQGQFGGAPDVRGLLGCERLPVLAQLVLIQGPLIIFQGESFAS